MKTILGSTDWIRLQEVFDAVIQLGGDERESYLEVACSDTPGLRIRVDSLIRAFEVETSIGSVVSEAASQTVESSLPAVGGLLGHFRISGVIGRGGMGIVYRAVRADDEYQKEVAIKVATFGLLSPDLRRRFLAERQILANLDHPNIARLLDGGTTAEGIPFVVMELVEGQPIDAFCDSHQLDTRQRIELMITVARSVDFAHRHLVVHRDLKPENVHVSSDGVPKLLDFGIAKALNPEVAGIVSVAANVTIDAERLMTPEYASPEQVLGQAITTATDVYQMGILLYFLLTGRRPFEGQGRTMGELEKSICQLPPRRPGVNPDIDRILLQALEKDPLRRYSSAEAFADDLNRYLNGYPVQARAGSFAYRSAKFVGRHRFGVAAAALFLLLIAGFSMGMALLARRASQQASIANQTTEFLLGLFAANDPAIGRGDKITARELLDKGSEQLDRMNQGNGADPVVEIRLLDNIASIYNSLGSSEKAKEMLEKALRLRRERLPQDEVAEADTLARLADVETDLSHYDQSLSLNQQALAAYRSRFKDADERIAIRLARISSDYWEQDKLPQAESYEREALALSTRLTVRNDPRTLEMIGDLGTIVDLEGRMPEAQRYYDEFLAAQQTLVPRNLPNLGLAWNYEGWLHYRMGHFAQAEQEMRNALALRMQGYGPAHPVTAGAQSSLAYILLCRGKDSEALSLAMQAKDTLVKLYGVTHRETAYAEDSLGLALLASGRAEEARREFQSAFQARQILLPPTHMQTGKTWMFLGQADFALGNLPLAAEESRKSLEILEHVYGPHGHPQVAEFDALHLQILAAQYKFNEAEEFGVQSLASFRKILPSDNWRLAAVESGLSLSLCQDGRPGQLSQGIALSREALAIYQASFGPALPQTARNAMRLSYCLRAAGQHEESDQLVRDAAAPLLDSRDPSYRIERGWLLHAKLETEFKPGLATAK